MSEPPTRTQSQPGQPGADPEYPFLGPPARPGDLGTLGPYHVCKVLGEGGMGCVFLAHDPALGRDVALKVMRPEQAVRADAKARFLREARAAAGLKSDHVVVVHAVGGDAPGEVPHLAMELLPGKPLDAWRKARPCGRASAAAAARVGRDALRGLAAAHASHLVHRDVKPSNLWVEPGGRVKLLDFGLARDTAGDSQITASGAVMGTAAYMAPEQALARLVDARADLFSLGVVLYELLTGTDPFRKATYLESMIAVRDEHPPPAAEVVPGVPPDLSAFVARLMSKDPADRPADATAALAELTAIRRRMKDGTGAADGSVGATAPGAGVTPPPVRRRRPWVLVGVALTAAVIGAWAGGVLDRSPASGGRTGSLVSRPTAPAATPDIVPGPIPPPETVVEAPSDRQGGYEIDYEIAPGVKMRFCWVPPGQAQLGSPAAERQAVLKIIQGDKEPDWLTGEAEEVRGTFTTAGFWLGKYEVTQAEWTAATGAGNPSEFNGANDNKAKGTDTARFPVEKVSWNDAAAFCNRASGHAGRTPRYAPTGGGWAVAAGANGFRLPHENEWEYACRGGKGNRQPFYFGNLLNGEQANCNGTYPFGTDTKGPDLGRTAAVGRYAVEVPHPWGLCDVTGNVWEWCENEYAADHRVVRGGAWFSYAPFCRTAYRYRYVADYRDYNVGFRLCLPQQ